MGTCAVRSRVNCRQCVRLRLGDSHPARPPCRSVRRLGVSRPPPMLLGATSRVRVVNETSARAALLLWKSLEFTGADADRLSIRVEPLGLPPQEYIWGPTYFLKLSWFYLLRLTRRDKRRQVRPSRASTRRIGNSLEVRRQTRPTPSRLGSTCGGPRSTVVADTGIGRTPMCR